MEISTKKIKNLLIDRKVKQQDVATNIGLTRQGFALVLKRETIKDEYAEKLADFFGVPVQNLQKEKKEITYGQNDHKLEMAVGGGGDTLVMEKETVPITMYNQVKEEVQHLRKMTNFLQEQVIYFQGK